MWNNDFPLPFYFLLVYVWRELYMDCILVYSKSILIIMNKVEFSINKTENDVHKTSDTSLRFFNLTLSSFIVPFLQEFYA